MKAKVNRFYMQFAIAGFTYHEGIEVFDKLKPGQKVELATEPENRFDPRAVTVNYRGTLLGYIPRSLNKEIWQFLSLGHHIFEAFINRISPDEHPENQVGVTVRIIENKTKEKVINK